MKELMNKIDRIVLFFVLYTLIFLIFFNTIDYTLPFVLALICALILKKPTLLIIRKLKINNGIASLITTTIFFAVILIILSFGIVAITQEAIQLGKNVQSYISSNYNNLYDSIYKLQKYYNNLDPYIINTFEKNFTGFIDKASNLAVSFSGKLVSYLVNLITTIPYVLMVILFTLLTTYFFTKDMTSSNMNISRLLPDSNTVKLYKIYNESKKMIGNYLLSYMIIISITFIETLIVFLIFKIKYALILSIVCAIADILPIIGIGIIYIPLALIYLITTNNYVVCFGLIISYLIVSIIRQIIEPKIVSSSLGIHPVAVLASLFIGLKVNGLLGVIFCIFLVIFYNIFKKLDML
ncbi:sporulation integral membrane protein YtvI [uncultured Clostridium sp.]|uniref:sporulation integral membrane protein YtvI n=1 Tax=uncultured Clostridium sp. TaxID=59620 RepID=UPI0025F153D8|nr:sporulation integral membrane protein YtvI [uncultured Clostridium sp.]